MASTPARAYKPRHFPSGGPLKRHTSAKPSGRKNCLDETHPAVVEGRTKYPKSVVDAADSPRLLIEGKNQRKIGNMVVKGRWSGMPIFCLTLEERATCPRSCLEWRTCFAPETKVLRGDLTWSRIDELHAGDEIVGFDEEPLPGKDRLFGYAKVEATREVFKPRGKVRTDRGEIIVTGDHLFLARRKHSTVAGRGGYQWLRADSLSAEATILFLGEPWEQDLSYDAGRVRGFVEGEGSICLASNNGFPKSRLEWAQLPGPLFDEINAAVGRLGFQVQLRQVTSGVNGSDVRHGIIGGGWREVLRFLGKIRPTRLLANSEGIVTGHSVAGRGSICATVQAIEDCGEGPVYEIATTSRTLVANGFLAHNCYGNGMNWARRHRDDGELMPLLWCELEELAAKHPRGFVVRLHILGDFYSVEYARFWDLMLRTFPALRVFGFTAHPPGSEIGRRLVRMNAAGDRCWIRFSGALGAMGSLVVATAEAATGVLCPAQTDPTGRRCCGSCGLCWTMQRPIEFVRH